MTIAADTQMNLMGRQIDLTHASERLVGYRPDLIAGLEMLSMLREQHRCLVVIAEGVELFVVAEGDEVTFAEVALPDLHTRRKDGGFRPIGGAVSCAGETAFRLAALVARGRVEVEAAGLATALPGIRSNMRLSSTALLLEVAQLLDERPAMRAPSTVVLAAA